MPVLEQVFERNTDKVKIVFKNFPIRGHAFAIQAAKASLAAQSMGKFWQFHDLLFKNYNALNDAKIEEIRKQLGLDAEKFKARMNAPDTLAQIRADANLGSSVGVRGTPTVFINGRHLKRLSPDELDAAVGKALRELSAQKPK